MRRAVILLACGCFASVAANQSDELLKSRRFFELRRFASADNPGTDLYRAILDARFGRESEAIGELQKILTSHPDPQTELAVHKELAEAFVRLSQYRAATAEYDAYLRLLPVDDPSRPDREDDRLACVTLSDTPPQTIEFTSSIPIKGRRAGLWTVPVTINSKEATWGIDTGANFSAVTESEAARLGIIIKDGANYANGSTGKRNSIRMGVADELHFGAARLRNVAFVVVGDHDLPDGTPRGFIGMPVLRALGRIHLSAGGTIRVDPTANVSSTEPNLFFDALTLVAEVRHSGQPLQMVVDSGAEHTGLHPSIRSALSPDEAARLRSKTIGSAGLGERVSRNLDVVPRIQFQLAGTLFNLKDVPIKQQFPSDFRYEDGVIGMDVLRAGFTLDFRAMRLDLDSGKNR